MNIALTLLSSLLVCFLHQGETEADSVGVKDSLRESMVSSEKKFPTPAVMATTNLYSCTESSLLPYQTLESVLRNSPSVDIRERGGKGVQTDICLRGGSFDQTQIKLNGVTFTDVRTGHQSHSLPVDMDIVGGVEVLDGVQGVGAYAGAINFNTAPLMPQYLRLHTTVGQFGYMYGNLSGAYTNGGTTFMGAVSGRRSGGYIHNTDFDNFNAFFRATSDTKAGLFDIQGGYQKRGFGANGFYSLSYPDQYEQTSTMLGSVRWLYNYGRWEYSATVSYRGNADRFELIRGDESKVPFNHHLTHNFGAEAWIAREWGWGRSSLGADLSYNEIYSNVLGDALPEPRKVLGTQYTKNGSRAVGNFWLRHNKYWDRFSVAFSGGFSSHPYGNGTMGSFEAGWYPMSGLKVCAGGVKSMRLPTFNDLYYTAKGYVSNPDLVPEEALMTRVGAFYNKRNFSASALVYHRWGTNIIDWVKAPGEDVWRSMQITGINTLGVELTAGWSDDSAVLRQALASYGYIINDKSSGGYISKYALDYMRNKLSVKLAAAPFAHCGGALKSVTVSAAGTLYDREGNYADALGKTMSYTPYFLLDGRLAWKGRVLELYLEGTNLLQTEYFDYGGLRMPPMWANLGVIATFANKQIKH